MKSTLADQAKALLESAQTLRYHGTPTHRAQRVSDHSWRMAALLRALHPDPSMDLLWAVLFHDSAERWVGDVPGPTKWWMAQEFAEQLDKLEEDILDKLGVKISLTIEEKRWLRALDKLEGYLFSVEEVNMGNAHLEPISLNFMRSLQEAEVPDEIRGFLEVYRWGPMSATLEEFNDDES